MVSKKIILTGNFSVGKTSLFNRFINNQFDDKYITTIGVKVNKKNIELDGQEVSLVLWDVAGEVSQDKVPTSYFLGSHGIIYVFDLTRPTTWGNIASDLDYLANLLPYAVIRVVGNKRDLVTDEELAHVKTQISAPWDILTSAKTGENVEALFFEIAKEIV
jgi:small GTP-binding protein